jgi:hypothetical protein
MMQILPRLCLSREDYEMMQILLVALPLKGRL